jgi:hypothetical protein
MHVNDIKMASGTIFEKIRWNMQYIKLKLIPSLSFHFMMGFDNSLPIERYQKYRFGDG